MGANKGIGLAVVERILAERPEAVVLLGSRDPSRGKAAAEALAAKHPGRVEALQIDVSSDESVAAAARAVEAKLGKGGLFGLVNNAGIYSAVPGECVSTNLKGVKRVTDAFAPLLAADGRVVNVSSGAGPSFVSGCSDDRRRFFLRKDATFDEILSVASEYVSAADDAALAAQGFPGRTDAMGEYGLSKALLNNYTASLAKSGVRVSACSPGFIATDLTRQLEGKPEFGGKTLAELGCLPPAQGTASVFHLLFGEVSTFGWYWGSDAQRSPVDRYRSPGSPPYDGE